MNTKGVSGTFKWGMESKANKSRQQDSSKAFSTSDKPRSDWPSAHTLLFLFSIEFKKSVNNLNFYYFIYILRIVCLLKLAIVRPLPYNERFKGLFTILSLQRNDNVSRMFTFYIPI